MSISPDPPFDAGRKLSRIEWAAGILTTFAAFVLHLVCLFYAGGLWRDEAGVVQLATLPTFGETWLNLGHESCPLLFPMAIRLWSWLGLGDTDFELRIYGLLAGILIVGALWLNGRALSRSVPLLSLGLLATNVIVVTCSSTLRAYGTGSVLMLVAITCVWRFVRSPSRGRWLIAALAALLSVQCLFQNAVLLLALCIAACVIRFRLRDPKGAIAVLAIGAPAAVSLLPYLQIAHKWMDWSVVSQTGLSPAGVWLRLSSALAFTNPWTAWLWFGLALLVAGRWVSLLRRGACRPENAQPSVAFFAATALITGVATFFIYVRIAALPTQVWYYLPLMTFAAVCVDAALADWLPRYRAWQLGFLCLMVAVSLPRGLYLAKCRRTNIDLLAADLREKAGPYDFIVVLPWIYGISFARYWHGESSWATIPPMKDLRFHRYDLAKEEIQMKNPIQPVLDKMASTLQSGNHVWVVGDFGCDMALPAELPPAPNSPWGWAEYPYFCYWARQAQQLIQSHAVQCVITWDGSASRASPMENPPVMLVSGWRSP